MSQKVLITGGFGYVGGRVAQALASKGFEVYLGTRQGNRQVPPWLPQARVVGLDWGSMQALTQTCSGMEQVVHLAAMNEHECLQDPILAMEVNGVASVRLLQAAMTADVRRFVYFSTAHVYGAPLVGRIDEQTLPRAQHPYAITHKVAEDFVLAAHNQKRIEGLVMRLSNGFGAATHASVNRWTLIGNDLCRQAVQQRKLVLKSSGLQWRDFVTLHDVGAAVAHLSGLDRGQIGDGLFNLGGEAPLRMIDIAQRISARCQAVLGFQPVLERPPPAAGEEYPTLDYRIDKLKATGFVPTGSVDDELDATLRLCAKAFAG